MGDTPIGDMDLPPEPPEIPEVDVPDVVPDAGDVAELPEVPETPEIPDVEPAGDTTDVTIHPTTPGNPEFEPSPEGEPVTISQPSPEAGYGGGPERGKVLNEMSVDPSIDTPGEMTEPQPEIAPETSGEMDQQIREASERLGQMPELQSDSWQQLDSTQRLETLQNIEATMAEIQGRPSVPVVAAEMSPTTFGGFDGQQIQINAGMLEGNSMPGSEMIDTIVHEGRHAYQQYAVDHPGFEADTALVASWAENMQPGNYLTPDIYGQELYQNQPVEADAWTYASQVIQGMKGRTS